ncbi:MAG: hypothetical protein HY682_01025 [Chloroflexi bacterium]|nr:hypothetical protein [Chloroflexota bacterium]
MPLEEKTKRVQAALELLPEASDVQVVEVTRGPEITVALSQGRSIADEGTLLLVLEARLREQLSEPVELYFRSRQDSNKLRQKLMRFQEWSDRRAEVKAKAEHQDEEEPGDNPR